VGSPPGVLDNGRTKLFQRAATTSQISDARWTASKCLMKCRVGQIPILYCLRCACQSESPYSSPCNFLPLWSSPACLGAF
jgi:hypothetical protein